MIGLALAAALSVAPTPRHPGLEPGSRFLAPAEEAAGPRVKPGVTRGSAVDAVAKRYGLAGEILVAKGDRILLDHAYGPIAPAGGAKHKPGERWRLASITKQVTAAATLLFAAENRTPAQVTAELDKPLTTPGDPPVSRMPAATRLDRAFGSLNGVTLRQLLTHHSGLANPDDTPASPDGMPSFYTRAEPDWYYCMSKPAQPGAPFRYNNCDYLAMSMLMTLISKDWPPGMDMATPGEVGVPGFVHGKPEPRFQLASWGWAGGLMGTARSVFAFDRSLMTGQLVPPALRDGELWKPEGHGSYQALGAWVFPGKLAGCAAPKRIVQRDGEIWGVQARNYILPDDDIAVVVFTNRSADDFAIGEVWEGKGFAFDLLSAAVGC